MVTGNPEIDFARTPEKFSDVSRVVGIEKQDKVRGIILESIDDFVNAIQVYNGGVPGARATQNKLLQDVGADDKSGMAVAFTLLGGAIVSQGFEGKLIKEAIAELKSVGRFHRSFDYNAMGTNFFKTTVECSKVGKRYVMELHAAYVGDKPEGELAKKLGKPQALVSSGAFGVLSIVDDWWFNVNFNEVTDPVLKRLSVKLEKNNRLSFEHKKKRFNLRVNLDTDQYLSPKGKWGENDRYFQTRGNNLVGGAWKKYSEDGTREINPVPRSARVEFAVMPYSSPKDSFIRTSGEADPIVIHQTQEARDYIATLIKL